MYVLAHTGMHIQCICVDISTHIIYICTYMRMYICKHVHTYVHTYMHVHMYVYTARMYVCTYVYAHTYICIYMHVRMYVYARTCVYRCTYVCMYMHVRTYVYTCMYVCICMYMHSIVFFVWLHMHVDICIPTYVHPWSMYGTHVPMYVCTYRIRFNFRVA